MNYRIQKDSLGEVKVPADKYWGAQTQRSYQNFKIGWEKMPREITHAFGILKKAAALANFNLGKLDEERRTALLRQAKRSFPVNWTTIFRLSSGRPAAARSPT